MVKKLIAFVILGLGSLASALTPFEAREKILTQFVSVHPISTWDYDWTTAVFLYGVVDSMPAQERVLPLARVNEALLGIWARRPAEITSPDLAAMSLPLALLPSSPMFNAYESATQTYFRTEPLNAGGVFDHVGPRQRFEPWLPPTSWLMPSSVWADSAVMYGLNGYLLAHQTGDAAQSEFFKRQLLRIHHWLWVPSAHLYKHAYFFASKSFAPRDGFWARGNLWMALAFERVLETMPANDPFRSAFASHFADIMSSLKTHANPDRGLTTLLDWQDAPNPYETTASALLAHLLMRGSRLGFLPKDDLQEGRRLAFSLARTQMTKVSPDRLSIRGISCPTTAMTWPIYYTRIVGECADQSYGIGAFLLMLGEL